MEDRHLLRWTNTACLGEFLLGYPNEYAGYTDRPLIDPARDAGSGLLPRAEDAPDRADIGRNGSYLVLRQLQQDVRGFWRFLDEHAGGNATRRRHLAEAMVGRAMDGEPLVGRMALPIDGIHPEAEAINAFDYSTDGQGLRCPLGAHVRRSNPRNGDLPPGSDGSIGRLVRMLGFDGAAREQDGVSSSRFHRLLRRGRSYGRRLSMDEALADWPPGDGPVGDQGGGLHFMCLNASIARQFEFVQGAWLAGTRLNGLPDESDPLVGQRDTPGEGEAEDHFSMPRADGQPARIEGLPTFVTVRGGGYFFLPGLRALRYLASV
jgi:deferrochelatase/peroxidase EfeB